MGLKARREVKDHRRRIREWRRRRKKTSDVRLDDDTAAHEHDFLTTWLLVRHQSDHTKYIVIRLAYKKEQPQHRNAMDFRSFFEENGHNTLGWYHRVVRIRKALHG